VSIFFSDKSLKLKNDEITAVVVVDNKKIVTSFFIPDSKIRNTDKGEVVPKIQTTG